MRFAGERRRLGPSPPRLRSPTSRNGAGPRPGRGASSGRLTRSGPSASDSLAHGPNPPPRPVAPRAPGLARGFPVRPSRSRPAPRSVRRPFRASWPREGFALPEARRTPRSPRGPFGASDDRCVLRSRSAERGDRGRPAPPRPPDRSGWSPRRVSSRPPLPASRRGRPGAAPRRGAPPPGRRGGAPGLLERRDADSSSRRPPRSRPGWARLPLRRGGSPRGERGRFGLSSSSSSSGRATSASLVSADRTGRVRPACDEVARDERPARTPDLGASEGRSSEKSRRRPTLPGGYPPSTIGAGGLHYRVRDGNGCFPAAIATGNL